MLRDGLIDKVHLVAKAFTQIEGIEHKETCSPIVRFFYLPTPSPDSLFGPRVVSNGLKDYFRQG